MLRQTGITLCACVLFAVFWVPFVACPVQAGIITDSPSCGNGILDPGEECDPPATTCAAECRADCTCDFSNCCQCGDECSQSSFCPIECGFVAGGLCRSSGGCAVPCPCGASCTTLDGAAGSCRPERGASECFCQAPPPGIDLAAVVHTTRPIHAIADLALADLDGDGDNDIVGLGHDGRLQHLEPRHGSRRKRGTQTDLPSLPGRGLGLAIGDVDGDGDNDIVACYEPKRTRNAVCVVLGNCLTGGSPWDFRCAPPNSRMDAAAKTVRPLLGDIDADGDVDVLLLSTFANGHTAVWRNDLSKDARRLTRLPEEFLPVEGIVEDVAILDAGRNAKRLLVVRHRAPDQSFEYDDVRQIFVDRTADLFREVPALEGGQVEAVDLDGDRRFDLVRQNKAGFRFLVQTESGAFTDVTHTVGGLPDLRFDSPGMVGGDFTRDGNADLFVTGKGGKSNVLLVGTATDGLSYYFVDRTEDAGVANHGGATAAVVAANVGDCDRGHDIATFAVHRTGILRVHQFPSDETGRTVVAGAGGGAVHAAVRDGCVDGSPRRDHLIGHREGSALRGADGDDLLEAVGGVTVMRGGLGRDEFRASEFTIVQLPTSDIEAGEVIDCRRADAVLVDTELPNSAALVEAGVVLVGCGNEPTCDRDKADRGDSDSGDAEHAFDCHEGGGAVLFTADLKLGGGVAAIEWGRALGFASGHGVGFGECRADADCYALGLNACRTASGITPFGGRTGRCYPSGFDGRAGPIEQWCHDPFWARYRYQELDDIFQSQRRRLVIPTIFWIVRSDAVDASGNCTVAGKNSPNTMGEWHDDIVKTMNANIASFGAWGITFDYQVRVIEVASDSPFVVEDEPCQTLLEPGDSEDNSVGALLASTFNKFRPGEANVYLTDRGGVDWSSNAIVNGQKVSFLLLRGGVGAFGHEMGHGLHLDHPFELNESASGTAPSDSESRDSWLMRAFPDESIDRLNRCANDAACEGIDAGPGDCRKAPGAALGFCNNLKKDCGVDGDSVCDTPWDTFPCWKGVSSSLGQGCDTTADCREESSTRGTAYMTVCGGHGVCVKAPCNTSDDCGGGSFCADGTCVIWKAGTESCCHLNTDLEPGFQHNACWERRPNGAVVAVPGVGAASTWPLQTNRMSYHEPSGLIKTFTLGQRDQSVCKVSYRDTYGNVLRKPHDLIDGLPKPCSLRPGDTAFDYGHFDQTRVIPHGACASGLCSVTDVGSSSLAFCVPAGDCSDGVHGAGETGTDCGGVCPNACPTSSTSVCAVGSDCLSGVCADQICEASCQDGQKNGAEVGIDIGGRSFDPTCPQAGAGHLCRYDEDCVGAGGCDEERNCVLSSDCPINDVPVPCLDDDECLNGGKCVATERHCASSFCSVDADCVSGNCQLPAGRCACTPFAGHCPNDFCAVTRSMCLSQCVDGRCLGECGMSISGG